MSKMNKYIEKCHKSQRIKERVSWGQSHNLQWCRADKNQWKWNIKNSQSYRHLWTWAWNGKHRHTCTRYKHILNWVEKGCLEVFLQGIRNSRFIVCRKSLMFAFVYSPEYLLTFSFMQMPFLFILHNLFVPCRAVIMRSSKLIFWAQDYHKHAFSCVYKCCKLRLFPVISKSAQKRCRDYLAV